MSENKDNDLLLDHNYDGIQEFDNPLPNWWLMTFFGTIIFGFIYWVHYEFGGGMSLATEHKLEVAKISAKLNSGSSVSEEKFSAAAQDPETLVAGMSVYTGKCAVCHGDKGQGLIGPNLTDHFWLHGKGAKADIYQVIAVGVLEKGMPNWQTLLSEKDMIAVTLLVASLKDSNPAGGKAPQGQEYP